MILFIYSTTAARIIFLRIYLDLKTGNVEFDSDNSPTTLHTFHLKREAYTLTYF